MLLLSLTALGRSPRRADWSDLAMLGLWTFWGLFASRNIGLYGLLTIPALARYADVAWGEFLPGERKRFSRELIETEGIDGTSSAARRSRSSARFD